MGSGTTGLVANKLGRHYVGIELNPQYVEIAKRRMGLEESQIKLFWYYEIRDGAECSLRISRAYIIDGLYNGGVGLCDVMIDESDHPF